MAISVTNQQIVNRRRSAARDEKHLIHRRALRGGRLDDDLGQARRSLEQDILIHRDTFLGVDAVGSAVDLDAYRPPWRR